MNNRYLNCTNLQSPFFLILVKMDGDEVLVVVQRVHKKDIFIGLGKYRHKKGQIGNNIPLVVLNFVT